MDSEREDYQLIADEILRLAPEMPLPEPFIWCTDNSVGYWPGILNSASGDWYYWVRSDYTVPGNLRFVGRDVYLACKGATFSTYEEAIRFIYAQFLYRSN
jgi:hypothetical protein